MDANAPAQEEGPETLVELVRRYSPTGGEADAVSYLVRRMNDLDFDHSFTDSAGNAVGIKGEGERQLLLLGHIDTVPGELPVRIEKGELLGRGTVDAKGSLACFVDAVARVDPAPGWQLVVVGAVDEEGDSRGARQVREAFRPEMAMIGEPSGWERLTLGYKGSISCRIQTDKGVAHGAAAEATASELCVGLWTRIAELAAGINQGRQKVFDQVSPRLRGLESGTDGLTEWAALEITTRLPPSMSLSAWRESLERLAGQARVDWRAGALPAYQASKSSKLVRLLLRSIRRAGGEPRFVLKSGTADLNVVGPAWGCPIVAYGPGDSNLDHTPQERVSIEEYGRAVDVLADALTHLSEV